MKLELTFNSASRGWRKMIGGKLLHFGHGESKCDIVSYNAALEKYQAYLNSPSRSGSNTFSAVVDAKGPDTLETVYRRFLLVQDSRYQAGEISAATVAQSCQLARQFCEFVGAHKHVDQIDESHIESYYAYQLTRISQFGDSKVTCGNRFRIARAFLRWCWEQRLCEQPRNFSRLRITCDAPAPQVFDLAELRKLWNAATPRVQMFMAIALFTGAGQTDISEMRKEELQGNYLVRARSKTGVASKHWIPDWLCAVIRVHQAKHGQLLFLNQDGARLATREFVNGKEKKLDAIGSVFFRLLRKCDLDNTGRKFYTLRKTGASMIEQIDPLATAIFLSHRDTDGDRMKRYYVQRDFVRLEVALRELDRRLTLGWRATEPSPPRATFSSMRPRRAMIVDLIESLRRKT